MCLVLWQERMAVCSAKRGTNTWHFSTTLTPAAVVRVSPATLVSHEQLVAVGPL
jgi:hypothetical protein